MKTFALAVALFLLVGSAHASDTLQVSPEPPLLEFRTQVQDARALDSLSKAYAFQARASDSAAHDLRIQAVAVYNAAVRRVSLSMKLSETDTIFPTGVILRAKRGKEQ